MSDHQTTDLSPAGINDIWVSSQELGAAIAPLLLRENPPKWVTKLRDALDSTNDAINDMEDERG